MIPGAAGRDVRCPGPRQPPQPRAHREVVDKAVEIVDHRHAIPGIRVEDGDGIQATVVPVVGNQNLLLVIKALHHAARRIVAAPQLLVPNVRAGQGDPTNVALSLGPLPPRAQNGAAYTCMQVGFEACPFGKFPGLPEGTRLPAAYRPFPYHTRHKQQGTGRLLRYVHSSMPRTSRQTGMTQFAFLKDWESLSAGRQS